MPLQVTEQNTYLKRVLSQTLINTTVNWQQILTYVKLS
jgi:hypothetical protein